MCFRDFLSSNRVYLDGGTGTLLQAAGLAPGVPTESFNLTRPQVLTEIHRAYYDAGSHVVAANTFGINALKYSPTEISAQVTAALQNVQQARALSTGLQPKFAALDLGPLGQLLKPLGTLAFEDAVNAFVPVIEAGVCAGADLVVIETMNDSLETKAALLAVKEHCDLPVLVSNAYGADGRLLSGATPEIMVALLEGMGADAIGVNCSLGPQALAPIAEKYLAAASVPVLVKPNAGLPRVENGKTVFDVSPRDFAAEMAQLAQKGVRCLGGCCGTTPEYIRRLAAETADIAVTPIIPKNDTIVTSGTRAVNFNTTRPVLVGERINPTGKKRLKQALTERDFTYILNEGLREAERGAHILDVNVGTPETDERDLLPRVAYELAAVTDLPLQLDTADAVAMERALRSYNGKALINSVNGKRESMAAVFPLVKKYGGAVVALTLDENGIPATAAGRVAIAEKILAAAADCGIDKKNIIFDSLTLTVGTDSQAAAVTLQALKEIRERLGCHTLLGVSNVSFGLPARPVLNSTFFITALNYGLSAAIMNPDSAEMMTAYYSWRALCGRDNHFADYIAFADSAHPSAIAAGTPKDLRATIISGLKTQAADLAAMLLQTTPALEIINGEIVPALDAVGVAYEQGTVFLPQLLMSAEAAAAAFAVLRAAAAAPAAGNGFSVILATVQGDIHDIGKNIVRLLLENYGFRVVDLGRDVSPQTVADAALREQVRLVGLSALMTTTVPKMAETVALLHQTVPGVKVVVGGAVLTAEYAAKIGADFYAKDAMETVRCAEQLRDKRKQ